jgi:arsenite methyltransferase
MALACPVDLDTARLRVEVQNVYRRVAADPSGEFHFHRGADYAVEFLGYDRAALDLLPANVTDSFAGVGNPHAIAPIPAAAVVLDIGSGAGTDLLLAASRIGPEGRAIGVDMTASMLERAREGARSLGYDHVELRPGEATALPVEDQSVDRVISNGVLNLVPDKPKAIAEMWRVLRPGGSVQMADITIGVELPESARRDIDLWTG